MSNYVCYTMLGCVSLKGKSRERRGVGAAGLLSQMDLAGETRQDLDEDGGCITEKHDVCRQIYCQELTPKIVETEKSQDPQLASGRVRGAEGMVPVRV